MLISDQLKFLTLIITLESFKYLVGWVELVEALVLDKAIFTPFDV